MLAVKNFLHRATLTIKGAQKAVVIYIQGRDFTSFADNNDKTIS